MIKRDQMIGEFFLRKHLQKVIQEVYKKHQDAGKAENQLRQVIQSLIHEAYSLKEGLSVEIEDDFVIPSEEEEKAKADKINKQSDEEKAVKQGLETGEVQDRTGINFAVEVVKRIGKQILAKYNMLDADSDKQYFYDWLFINTLLAVHGKEKNLNPNNPDEAFPPEFLSVIEKYSKKVDQDDETIDDPGAQPLEHPTGITALAEVWLEVEKAVGKSYASLTTDIEQRYHFTKALINGLRNLIDPQRVLRVIEKEAGDKPTEEATT